MVEDLYPTRGESIRVFERRDPVVYAEGRDRFPYETAVRLRRFERDGYLFLPGLFHKAETAELLKEAERLKSRAQREAEDSVFLEQDSGAVRSIFAVHESSRLFRSVAEDPRLLRLACDVLGDEVYVHQSRLNYKPAFSGREFYWHSDFETWHAEDGMPRMRALSISLCLTPSYATNGPLMLIPGSHSTFVACVGETPPDHFRQSLVKQEIGTPDQENLRRMASRRGIKAPTGAAGSVIAFDCNTMHASAGNLTPFPRTNFFVVYNAISNQVGEPFAAVRPRPEFVATRERVQPLPRRSQ